MASKVTQQDVSSARLLVLPEKGDVFKHAPKDAEKDR